MISIDSLRFQHPSTRRDETAFQLSMTAFSVADGERVAVVGPSGSGKTTLLNLIAGLYRPQQGRIRVHDTEVSRLSDRAARAFRLTHIGFVFQDFELIDYLTALDNILLPCRIGSALTLNNAMRERARSLAESAGLSQQLHRRPGALSQGEKQRVALCRALLPGPKVILADEATGNLDPDNKERIMQLLVRQANEEKATLLAVTHDHDLLPWFDRVVDFRTFREREAL